jgi:hypothetical protein
MPCLVDKVGIRRNGIDLTADLSELLILLCQILQLRRTDKGKVRRIEEEYAPLAHDILFADKLEFVLMIGISAKIGNFPVDH